MTKQSRYFRKEQRKRRHEAKRRYPLVMADTTWIGDDTFVKIPTYTKDKNGIYVKYGFEYFINDKKVTEQEYKERYPKLGEPISSGWPLVTEQAK